MITTTVLTYKGLESDLRKAFEKTGIEQKCYDNKSSVGGSGWELGHPNGSISVTFWLMSDDADVDELIYIAKDWSKKHNLITATYYPNGIISNINPVKHQDWNNRSAMSTKFIYGFTFFRDNYACKKIYTEL